jgi:uncharacterized membrane protein
MIQDPTNYRFGIFYFNRKDKRVIVPKRFAVMGWTLNFGNIFSWLLILSMVAIGLTFSFLNK